LENSDFHFNELAPATSALNELYGSSLEMTCESEKECINGGNVSIASYPLGYFSGRIGALKCMLHIRKISTSWPHREKYQVHCSWI